MTISRINSVFTLKTNKILVLGASRAAIYDLKNGEVYSLNHIARNILLGKKDDHFNFIKELKVKKFISLSNFLLKPLEVRPPQLNLSFVWLELTSRCNQKCLHCYASSTKKNTKTKELNFRGWVKVLHEIRSLGCRQIQFIGGEPLMFRKIFDLASEAKKLKFNFIEIFTNGTLLDNNKIRVIKKLGLRIALSFYSFNPTIHDKITKTPGSFDRVCSSLKQLKMAKIPTRIGLVIMKYNQNSLQKTLSKLKKMGFSKCRIDIVRPTGRGSCSNLLPGEEIIKSWALRKRPFFKVKKQEFLRNLFWNSCWAGKFAITTTGNIILCIFARKHILGNVKMGIKNIIKSKGLKLMWHLTKDKVHVCRDCEYRYCCKDCRPLAEDVYHNLYRKNPYCCYNPFLGLWEVND